MMRMAEGEVPTQSTDLADLVRVRRAELGLSYESLGKLCVDPKSGTRVGGSWLHRLETGLPVRPPSPPKLHAIAAGLGLESDVVQAAASAQFVHGEGRATYIYPREGVRLLVSETADLGDDDIDLLVELAKTLARKAREREHGRIPEPDDQ